MTKRKTKKVATPKEKKKVKLNTRTPAASFAAFFTLVVPVVAVLGLIYVEQNELKTQMQQNLVSFFKPTFQNQMKLALEHLDLIATSLQEDGEIKAAMAIQDTAALNRRAQAYIKSHPETHSLRLIPFQSIQRPEQTEPKMRYTELDMMRKLEKDEPVTLELVKEEGKTLIRYGLNVKNSSGNIVGTILLNLDKSLFDRFFSTLPSGFGYFELSEQSGTGKKTWFTTGTPSKGEPPLFLEIITVLDMPWRIEYQSPSHITGLDQDQLTRAAAVGLSASFILLLVLLIVKKAWTKAIERNLQQLAAKVSAYSSNQVKTGYTLPGFAAAHRNLSENIDAIKQKLINQSQKHNAPTAPHVNTTQKPKPEEDRGHLDMDLDLADDDLFESIDAAGDDLLTGNNEPAATTQTSNTGLGNISVPAGIFRQYDIRGIMGDSINAAIVTLIGKAIGTQCLQRGDKSIVIGRDGRTSSPELAQALKQGLTSTGCNVIDIGAVPTPIVYFGTKTLGTGSCVMLTGSHNPPEYNGLKVMIKGETLHGSSISNLHSLIEKKQYASGDGEVEAKNILGSYIDKVASDISLPRKMKVVIDTGNGVAGPSLRALMEKLGCEFTILHEEIDGTFPNHHPDPSKPSNLSDLIKAVTEQKADLGLAFDGDGDRLGVITSSGKPIFPDRLLMLFIKDILPKKPGGEIIYDVKCTSDLATLISERGGKATMWKTGHSLIKSKIQETGAVLGGEMSGHIFFNDRWYGFDDALYSAARLLELLSNGKQNLDQMVADLPQKVSTPEINIPATETGKFQLIDSLIRSGTFTGKIVTLDGIRVQYENGWGLIRASNTTPSLVARFEADTGDNLTTIQEEFRTNIQKIDNSLRVPF